MAYLIKLSAFIVFLSLHHVQSRTSMELERTVLNSIFEGYDPTIRPTGKNGTGPVVVTINTYIRSLSNIDDVKMVYDAQITFRQSWVDDRLKYDQRGINYVSLSYPEKLWIPDLFFSNEDTGHFHNMITPNNLIRIYPDGTILYSTRISLRLFCPMDLRNYPMDKQTCKLICASYAYTTEDLIFVWKDYDPVQISKNAVSNLPKFTMDTFNTDYCTSKTNTGEYSCVFLAMEFYRNFFYYLERCYMPTMALVLLSWVVFWLSPRCTNIRLGIWVGILISITIVTTSINSNSPEVSYTKAMDVWMGTCVCFIFFVLLELCLVNDAVTKEENTYVLKNQLASDESTTEKMDRLRSYKTPPLRWLNKYSTRAQRIDVVSRFLFPAMFAFFNFVYWITYAARRS
ncbi:Glutamate-gated chloride channel [Araneus ventricosus]|uniref:Glutamate-gated chloride channel n=1 Tax=Araneus ventricosus TaxID=182803 RepID=A0A4Y2BYT7_ARAVE|nr:Glutamate-gated chloride channel [Araneus ventricosus]